MRTIKRATSLLLLAAIFTGTSCKKSNTCTGVPNVSVYASIDLSLPSYNALVPIGGAMVVTGGYDNIVIYHYTASQMTAFDCCCPYDGQSNSKAIVQLQSSNKLIVTCPVCGSSFLLSDGSVNHGPATCPIKKYNNTYDGSSNQFNVTN